MPRAISLQNANRVEPTSGPRQAGEGADGTYPRWLHILGLASVAVTIAGVVLTAVAPGAATKLVFPLGLVLIWMAGRVARKYS